MEKYILHTNEDPKGITAMILEEGEVVAEMEFSTKQDAFGDILYIKTDYRDDVCVNGVVVMNMYHHEDYDMLARENKAMAQELKKLGYTNEQINKVINK